MCKCQKKRQQQGRLFPGRPDKPVSAAACYSSCRLFKNRQKKRLLARTRLFLFPDCFSAFSYGLITVTPFMYFLSASGTSMEPSSS